MTSINSKGPEQSLDEKPTLTQEELENLKNDQEATRMAEAIVKALNEAVLKNHSTS